MKYFIILILIICCVTYAKAIPEEEIIQTNIYCGNYQDFNNAAEVDYISIVKATPEYKSIQKKDVGTAYYWLQISKANDHAIQLITKLYEDEDSTYDLITLKGYLGELEPPIDVVDITEEVIELM